MDTKSELWWVSVGGNPCEPARIKDGEIFTIGCCDGTPVGEGNGIILVERIEDEEIPLNPEEAEKARKDWEQEQLRREREVEKHRYRKFD